MYHRACSCGFQNADFLTVLLAHAPDIDKAESFCDVVSTLATLSVFSSLIISVAQVGRQLRATGLKCRRHQPG
jgi:hypothetical protein